VSDTLTGTTTEAISDAPDYPMARASGCPFAPPPEVMALAEARRCPSQHLGRQHPLAHHRLREARTLFSRSSGSASTTGGPASRTGTRACCPRCTSGPDRSFTADAEEHHPIWRMLSKPFTFKRVEGLRPAIQQITTMPSTRCWAA